MTDNSVFEVPTAFAKTAKCGAAQYEKMYKESVESPDKFWGREGKRLDWIKPYTKVKNG